MPPRFQPSNHFDGTRFFNPAAATPPAGQPETRRGLWQILRWRLGDNGPAWPLHIANKPYPAPASPLSGQAAVTFIGHATFLVRLPGCTILTDPVFSERASPLSWIGPKRVRAPGMALADLPAIDLILLSHNHYDHADLASLRALGRAHGAPAVTLLGNGALLGRAGLHAIELDWWDSTQVAGLTVTATPARHFSRRGAFDANRTLWGGFMLQADEARILFAGDSGSGGHWAMIRNRLGAPNLALLPIGAYAPRWLMAPVHMNPEEAVHAHLALGARQSIGMHFGTFRLTDEAYDAPVLGLLESCATACVTDFTALDVGESRLVDL